MTTSQSRYQGPSPELNRCPADQLSEGRSTTPRLAESAQAEPPAPSTNRPPPCDQPRPLTQPVPPPQFGRLTHAIRSSAAARARVRSAPASHHDVSHQAVSHQAVSHQERGLQSAPLDVNGAVGAARVPGRLADFGARTVSALIDYVAPVVVLNLLLAIAAGAGGTAWRLMLIAGGYLWLLGFCLWNSGYLQGTTGRSLGRRVANTKLVGIETGQPVGFGRAVARQICHLAEFGIGYLWPLWDGKRQTFADKIFGTVVVHLGGPTKEPEEHVGQPANERGGEPTEDPVGTDHRKVEE